MPESNSDTVNIEQKWIVTHPRFVGFIDIMGFKDLVARSSHNEILKMMVDINGLRIRYGEIKWTGSAGGIRSSIFSDSIVFYSKDDTKESLHAIVCTIAALSEELFSRGIAHKGAISCGEMTVDIDNSIFFGQALIDAYLLQEELYMYGVVMHGTAERKLNTFSAAVIPFLYEYSAKFKGGQSKHVMLYPINLAGHQIPNSEYTDQGRRIEEGFIKLRYNASGRIRTYSENTKIFMDLVSEYLISELDT